jgi:hypothetical protein
MPCTLLTESLALHRVEEGIVENLFSFVFPCLPCHEKER